MLKMLLSPFRRGGAVALAALVSMFVFGLSSQPVLAAGASAIDVADVTETISNQITPINAIGGAVLGILILIAAYKWVRRAA